jgi:hypothetical protein
LLQFIFYIKHGEDKMAKDVKSSSDVPSFNRELNLKEAAIIIEQMLKIRRPVMLWSQPGLGKSDLIKQIGKKTGRNVIDVRMQTMDPTDLRGIPYKGPNDRLIWATPSMFPTDPNDTSIVFFDEINTTSPSNQAAAMQLMLDHRVGEYEFPKGVSLLAAGNRESDKAAAQRMPSALSNRLIHLDLGFHFETWRDWAFEYNQHPLVVGFLSAFNNYANTFNAKTNSKTYATPRTWAFVSQILGTDLPEDLMMDAIAGTVGTDVMLAFRSHRKYASKLPNPDDVLTGKVEKLADDAKDISLQHALSVSLLYRLNQFFQTVDRETGDTITKKEWYKLADNLVRFVDSNFEPEIAMMTVKVAVSDPFRMPFHNTEMPAHRAFFTKNAKLFKGIKTAG